MKKLKDFTGNNYKSNNKKKCVMLIPPQELPIPAVGGGAIETLITHLLDENEIQKKMRIIVISTSDVNAEKHKYFYSKIYYNDDGKIKSKFYAKIKINFLFLRIKNRIKRSYLGFRHKTEFGNIRNSDFFTPDFFYFQCYYIAKKEGVEYIVNEGDWNALEYKIFHKLCGKEKIYYHLHCEIKENVSVRKCIPNSIAISKYVKDQWTKTYNIPGRNIVVYNCIDINRFSVDMGIFKRKELRESLGVCESELLAIFCGRLIPEKGIDKLLDAFELLKDFPVKLLVIGTDSFSKGNVSEFSRNIVERIKRLQSVSYLGYVSNEEIVKYYKISDFQIVPSVWQEGAGLVVIEGMASGLPLIITESGGMVEYVTDDCAIKLPINETLPMNISETIKSLIQDRERLIIMGRLGKERAKIFSKEKYYKNFETVFDK